MPSEGAGPDPATIWVVEDNAEYRGTVLDLIDGEEDLVCPSSFGAGEDLFEHLNNHFAPDLLLVDIGLPGMNGIEVVERVRRFAPTTEMVMLTIHEDNDRIFQAICAGACGYLLKTATPDMILEAVREALKGGAPMTPQIARRVLSLFTQLNAPRWDYQLTDREQEVLKELVDGKTKKAIGKALFLSEHTIDTHLRNIYGKLHVHSKTEAVTKALQERLIRLDPKSPA